MIFDQIFLKTRLAPLLTAWCLIVATPMRADQPASAAAPSPAQSAASSPTLDTSMPILRPLPTPEGEVVTDSGAGQTSGSDMSATSAAVTPSATISTTQSSAGGTDSSATQSAASADNSSTPPAASGDSSNAWKSSYIDLLNLLVQRGVITKKDSGNLISKAQQAAAAAAPAPAPAAAASPLGPPAGANSSEEDDTVRVTYVPDTVKQQIRDEVKDDVLKQAREENWAAPNAVPEWVTRYHVTADIRVRYQGEFFPSGNDDTPGSFLNFNSINTGSPYNLGTDNSASPPSYDVNQDRTLFRLRARFGALVDVGQGFSAGLRVGTGQDDNPVTENQTLGGANNGQGGNFSKYAIWLDRGFLRYELGDTRDQDLTISIGRFDNPFFSSSMIWANDIGFDGLAVQARYKVADGITPFFTAGGFPVFDTDLNFASTSAAKFNSEDKYLFAAQAGADWNVAPDITLKTAVAIYDFQNIEGKVSDPFTPLSSSDQGDTDDSRPSFAQNGNTYIALRDITADAQNGFGTTMQYQYFGLATPFQDLALTGQIDFSQFDPFHISLLGEFVKNLAFDRSDIESNGPPQLLGPINNVTTPGVASSFNGGDIGYNARLTLGAPALQKLWDWNVNLTYRYVQSDATVDAFTDSDFGGPLVGTNLKGYMIGGNLGLSSRVWTSLQWMSADAIAGPAYQNDLIQVDINAKF